MHIKYANSRFQQMVAGVAICQVTKVLCLENAFSNRIFSKKQRGEVKMKKKLISGIIAASMILFPTVSVFAEASEPVSQVLAAGDVAINEANFPDPVFREWLKDPWYYWYDGTASVPTYAPARVRLLPIVVFLTRMATIFYRQQRLRILHKFDCHIMNMHRLLV